MVSRIRTVAFSGIEVLPVDVQVQIAAGLPAFALVGLADKAVAESRDRVRGALSALGLRCHRSASPSTWHRPIF